MIANISQLSNKKRVLNVLDEGRAKGVEQHCV